MKENISMLQTALRFLDEHNEISFATCEGDLPKIRIFQIMRREDHMLYFATSAEKQYGVNCCKISMWSYWHTPTTSQSVAEAW